MMDRHEAARLLSVPTDAFAAEVRSAFARGVMADHPDRGGDGKLLARLQQARDVMLCQDEVLPCNFCEGSGRRQGRFGAQRCTACGGSGETK